MSDLRADVCPLHIYKSPNLPLLNTLYLQQFCWIVRNTELDNRNLNILFTRVIKLYTDTSVSQTLCHRET